MNLVFNESFLRRFNHLALPVAILWSLSTIGGALLSQRSTEGLISPFDPFYEVFHLGEKFPLMADSGVIKGKTVTTTALVSYPHRIKAIYRAPSGSFVSISDGKETTVVALGGKYKNDFSLIGLSDTSAIFKGNGKNYRLRLGFDDPLSRKEKVTRMVSDPSQPGEKENEWRSIARTVVMSQIKDLPNIHKRIYFTKVYKGSKIDGFRIKSIDANSVFAQLGLKRGDIIVAVNNKRLLSYADAFNAYSQIPHLRSIQITVLRNNLPKDIVYEITR